MNRNHIAWWRLTKTRFALVLYYVAIVSLVVMTGLIIWKLIISNPSITEPWSVAGLAATILGVAATLLAILGAVAVGAWWLNLENRVRDQVNKLYNEQIEPSLNKRVTDQVDLRYNQQVEELDKKLHSEVLKHLVTRYELDHLRYLASSEPLYVEYYTGKFMREMIHMNLLNFIDGSITSLETALRNGKVNVKDYVHITDEGKAHLKEMEQN